MYKTRRTVVRHGTMIIEHEISKGMYSHNDKIDACSKETVLASIPKCNTEKSPRNLRTGASKPLAHKYILKYININIYINIREGMREERERGERVVGRGEREREKIWCF